MRFWLKTSDRFFLAFAVAFLLFAMNQLLATWVVATDEHFAYIYLLRVLGYLLILSAIFEKNRSKKKGAAG